ncbi:hypothetical protein MUG84_00190 [Paenibacillus sp. KQZ6P-2]|uniref:Uncharacterized protein n=1 Tax=Paenibacillus mangrovi TaxID=2931978 RepID=A0A9X1WR63_9BACL|nr:hypothetical protein [Paenibacillus mangrovi]MCJ8010159.1 hypothetical protein [Paenibacillus mangrovi]
MIGFDNITLLREDGKKDSYIYMSCSMNVRTRMSVEITVYDSEGNEIKEEETKNNLSRWIIEGLDNEDVASILRYFRKPNWMNLYKIYEVIRDDLNGEAALISKNYIPRKDIKRFTQSAQSKELLGDEARHASLKYKPPEIPMNIDEARQLIKQLFEHWVISKK